MASFWLPSLFKPSSEYASQQALIRSLIPTIEGKNSEKKMILDKEKRGDIDNVNGIRCMGLAKTFKAIISQKETEALKGVYFEIKKGELLGVMGHNGAGKTTLINTLCGLVNKDEGNVRIFDSNISENLQYCRKRMGVVSQFDVLWDELTGIEHM